MAEQEQVFVKCAWRLIPLMMMLYFINIIDRVNVGFAALTMNKALGFTPDIYGFGAGAFFLGYALFQVPANAILERVGARRWIFCILLAWGALSAANASVAGPHSSPISTRRTSARRVSTLWLSALRLPRST